MTIPEILEEIGKAIEHLDEAVTLSHRTREGDQARSQIVLATQRLVHLYECLENADELFD